MHQVWFFPFSSALTVLCLCHKLQEAHMQISTKTTWSTAWTTTGFRHRYRSRARRHPVRTRTAGRRRRLSCWCVTGRAQDNKAGGIRHHRDVECFLLTVFIQTGWSFFLFIFFINFWSPHRFGNPFILYLERTVTWDVLQKEILEKMRHLLRPGVLVQVFDFCFFLSYDKWQKPSLSSPRHCQPSVWQLASIMIKEERWSCYGNKKWLLQAD